MDVNIFKLVEKLCPTLNWKCVEIILLPPSHATSPKSIIIVQVCKAGRPPQKIKLSCHLLLNIADSCLIHVSPGGRKENCLRRGRWSMRNDLAQVPFFQGLQHSIVPW